MTSEAKIAANRRNAKRSTGPRTDAGKARSRRNALQHGLAVPLHLDRGFSVQIEALATCFSEHEMAARECTRIAAEAHLEVLRVRQAKVELINTDVKNATARAGRGALGDDVTNALAISANIKRLMALERYERRALSRRRRALCVPRRRAQGRTLPGDRKHNLFMQPVAKLDVAKLLYSAVNRGGGPFRALLDWKAPDEAVMAVEACVELADKMRGSLSLTFVTDNATIVQQSFECSARESSVGGRKWLLRCPETKRMVTALYLCKGESRFRSRQAAKLRYRSQRRRVGLAIQPRQDGP